MENYLHHDWVSVYLTGVGIAVALFQYYSNSHKRSATAVADEIEKFNEDPSVHVATRLLGWRSGKMPFVAPDGKHKVYVFDEQFFRTALRPHTMKRCEVTGYKLSNDIFAQRKLAEGENCDYIFSEGEQFVRDQFDMFLGRLERIEMQIRRRVMSGGSFRDFFSYWLDVLGGKKPGHLSEANRQAFIRFVEFYEYKGVQRLFARYGKPLVLAPRQPV